MDEYQPGDRVRATESAQAVAPHLPSCAGTVREVVDCGPTMMGGRIRRLRVEWDDGTPTRLERWGDLERA